MQILSRYNWLKQVGWSKAIGALSVHGILMDHYYGITLVQGALNPS